MTPRFPFSRLLAGAVLVTGIGGLLVALTTGVWRPAVPRITVPVPAPIVKKLARTSFPGKEGYVVDEADVLTPAEETRLEETLVRLDRTTCHQIALLTVPSLGNEPLESFSLRVGNQWGIGRSGLDNGILILVAVRDRKARIELGYGFAQRISDERAGEILSQEMIPSIRDGRFAEGFGRAVSALTREAAAWDLPIAPCQP